MTTQPVHPNVLRRQAWMAVLAKSSLNGLSQALEKLQRVPSYRFLRSPETGLTMVRGRAGGTGQAFNLGEITLTRCVVQLQEEADEQGNPITGFGYVGGRSHRHAELAALFDALLQHPEWFNIVSSQVIGPLQETIQYHREKQQRQTEATRVNFFTMARAETLERS